MANRIIVVDYRDLQSASNTNQLSMSGELDEESAHSSGTEETEPLPDLNESPVNKSPAKKTKDKRKGRRAGKNKKKNSENADDASYLHQLPIARELPQPPIVNVPVESHYEVRPIPTVQTQQYGGEIHVESGKDEEDQGLFATEPIKQGTRIICEPPVIALPDPGDQVHAIIDAFDKLPKSQQDRFWSLKGRFVEQLSSMTEYIDEFIPWITEIINTPVGDRTKEEQAAVKELGPHVARLCRTWRIAARFYANRHAMTTATAPERSMHAHNKPATGLFIEPSRLRHSCVPNCFLAYNPVTNQMTVHTTKNVQKGQELTGSCIGPQIYYHSAGERAKILGEYNIKCKCEACYIFHPKYKQHETLRHQIHTKALFLEASLTDLAMHNSRNATPEQLQLLSEEHFPPVTEDEIMQLEQTTLDLLKDLKSAGCECVEHIRWRNALIDRIQPQLEPGTKKWLSMTAHAKANMIVGKRCFGEDSFELEPLKRSLEWVDEFVKTDTEKMVDTVQEMVKQENERIWDSENK